MSNARAFCPPNVYVNVSESSSAVAVIGSPMFCPEGVPSLIDRVVLEPSVNTSPLVFDVSSTSVMFIVTVILSDNEPSDTVMVTEYEVFVS